MKHKKLLLQLILIFHFSIVLYGLGVLSVVYDQTGSYFVEMVKTIKPLWNIFVATCISCLVMVSCIWLNTRKWLALIATGWVLFIGYVWKFSAYLG